MRKEAINHLTSIIVTFILRYGTNYSSHISEMFDYWDGPLSDDNIFLYKNLLLKVGKWKAKKLMESMNDLELHPIFNRDFMQGVIDGVGNKLDDNRLWFFGRPYLKEFLESSEHPFNIRFKEVKGRYKSRKRTDVLSFLSLPLKGYLDSYFAGALSGSTKIYKDGEVFCRLGKNCLPNIKRLGILYTEYDKYILISAHYLMLFCGDLPSNIFSYWLKVLDKQDRSSMVVASLDALMNWRMVFGIKRFEYGDLPYLRCKPYYYKIMDMPLWKIDEKIKEKNLDFVDERVKNRIERWYNISVPKQDPILSPIQA